jgi:hypothetical protein
MDRIAELVELLEPEVAAPPPDLQSRQRDALLRFMASAEEARTRPGHRRPRARHRGWYLAIAGAAAVVAVVAATLVPRSSNPRPPVAAPGTAPGTSAVLTAVTRALANTSGDIEEVQSSVPAPAQLSSTSWTDLTTGACRTDTSVNGQPSLTVFVRDGSAVFIDYRVREWWTRDTRGVTCEPPLTPQTIMHDVTTGDYRLAGHATVGGQSALQLVSSMTTAGAHPVTKVTTLWVNATTYLPIQSNSLGHAEEQTVFSWLRATSVNAAMLKVKVPAGFRSVATAPSPSPSGL